MKLRQQLGELERYLNFVETYLEKRSEKAHAETEQWELEEYFPNLLRSTVFLLLNAAVESELNRICTDIKAERNLTTGLEELKGSGIQRAANWLSQVGKVNFPEHAPSWERLLEYKHLRNVMMHTQGQPDKGDHRCREYITDSPHLDLNQDDRILIDKQFCLDALATVREFFTHLNKHLLDQEPDRSQT